MVKLADTLDLGSNARACRFKSCHPYHSIKNEPDWFVFCFLGKNDRTCGNLRLPTNYVCNLHCVQLTTSNG